MAPPTIMLIRHAEKPDKSVRGVTWDGSHDEHGLSVRGWTRAGALAALFAHIPEDSPSGLVTPQRIVATAPSHSAKSRREVDTASPIAERLAINLDSARGNTEVKEVAHDLLALNEPVLVVWHHGSIHRLVEFLPLAEGAQPPTEWPEDRFDLIWVLTHGDAGYSFLEVEQRLLAGDSLGTPIGGQLGTPTGGGS